MKKIKAIFAASVSAIVLSSVMLASGCSQQKSSISEYALGTTVSVSGGVVAGTESVDGEVAVYKGIPYAAPPVDGLRWRAPQPVEPWEGELDCTVWGANALQGDAAVFSYWTEEFIQDTNPSHYRGGVVYSEDCLTLNIWSSYAVTENKPVIVFIHGGGYNTGGASCEVYDGEKVARSGAVFVSIQYRVGALGYMATPALINEGQGAGNFGLLDQIAALKWVNENISKFGGNPENVTVFGQSAGAGSVNALICSPLAKGLFSKAVSASHNSITRNWQTVDDRIKQLNLSYKGKRYADMTADELRAIPSSELKGKTLSTGGPCIDGYALTGTYIQTVREKKHNPVKLISGNVERDELISSVYTNAQKGITAVDSMLALQNAVGKLRVDAEETTYIYMFGHNVPRAASGSDDPSGAKHSYELAYFFGNFSKVSGRNWTDADYALGEKMMNCLITFCTDGVPLTDGLEWEPNGGGLKYMNFSGTAEMKLADAAKTAAVEEYYNLFN